MVKIELISFENNIATIICFPEGEENNKFFLKLDMEHQVIIENSLNKKGNSYAVHAAWKMYDIYKETGILPSSATTIWC